MSKKMPRNWEKKKKKWNKCCFCMLAEEENKEKHHGKRLRREKRQKLIRKHRTRKTHKDSWGKGKQRRKRKQITAWSVEKGLEKKKDLTAAISTETGHGNRKEKKENTKICREKPGKRNGESVEKKPRKKRRDLSKTAAKVEEKKAEMCPQNATMKKNFEKKQRDPSKMPLKKEKARLFRNGHEKQNGKRNKKERKKRKTNKQTNKQTMKGRDLSKTSAGKKQTKKGEICQKWPWGERKKEQKKKRQDQSKNARKNEMANLSKKAVGKKGENLSKAATKVEEKKSRYVQKTRRWKTISKRNGEICQRAMEKTNGEISQRRPRVNKKETGETCQKGHGVKEKGRTKENPRSVEEVTGKRNRTCGARSGPAGRRTACRVWAWPGGPAARSPWSNSCPPAFSFLAFPTAHGRFYVSVNLFFPPPPPINHLTDYYSTLCK